MPHAHFIFLIFSTPFHTHFPFPPTPSITPIPQSPIPMTHCTIQPLHLHWHPLLPISSPQPSRLLSNHTPFYSSTFLRFCKFTENNKLPINRPIKAYTSLSPAYYKPIISLFIANSPFPPTPSIPPIPHSHIPILTHCTIQPSSIGTLFTPYPPHNHHGS